MRSFSPIFGIILTVYGLTIALGLLFHYHDNPGQTRHLRLRQWIPVAGLAGFSWFLTLAGISWLDAWTVLLAGPWILALIACLISYFEISKTLANRRAVQRLLLKRRGYQIRTSGRTIASLPNHEGRSGGKILSGYLNPARGDRQLKLFHGHLKQRARLFGVAALIGHAIGLLAAGLGNSGYQLDWSLYIFFLTYSFWILERFSHLGGLIALRRLDPLWLWPRIWKEYGVLIAAVGFIAAAIGVIMLVIALVS